MLVFCHQHSCSPPDCQVPGDVKVWNQDSQHSIPIFQRASMTKVVCDYCPCNYILSMCEDVHGRQKIHLVAPVPVSETGEPAITGVKLLYSEK